MFILEVNAPADPTAASRAQELAKKQADEVRKQQEEQQKKIQEEQEQLAKDQQKKVGEMRAETAKKTKEAEDVKAKGGGKFFKELEHTDPAKTREANAKTIEEIEKDQKDWRVKNTGKTYDLQRTASQKFLDTAEKTGNLKKGDRREDQLRGLIRHAWTNDARGYRLFSTAELGHIYNWGKENYKDAEGNFDKEAFKNNFRQLFSKSIDEDTPFSKKLILQQWANAAGSSTFLGSKGEDFKDLFDSMGHGLAQDVARKTNAKPGTVLASYHGQGEHEGFDNVQVVMGEDRKPEIKRSPSGNNKGKIGYYFGDNESKTSKAKPKAQPAVALTGLNLMLIPTHP